MFQDIDNDLPSGALGVQLTQVVRVQVIAVVVLMVKEFIIVPLLVKLRILSILRLNQKELLVWYLFPLNYDLFCTNEIVGFVTDPCYISKSHIVGYTEMI